MFGIGLDCGSASVKATLLSPDGKIQWKAHALHYGRVKYTVHLLLGQLLEQVPNACGFPVGITGSSGDTLVRGLNNLLTLGEIPAIEQGSRLLAPNVRSVIEIGSQSARFLTGIGKGLPPQFSVNEHCAGGTGFFFEDQMSRLGLPMEEYSALVTRATTIPRLSGRCAVFAKTDIIHRQQEGVPTPDILLGLCYAMVRNYKAVIVRSLPVEPPVVLCGGVAQNVGVVQAVQEIFGLSDQELIVPDDFLYTGAVGAAAAVQKKGGCSLGELMANMFASQTEFAGPVGQPPLRLLPGTCLEEPTVTESIPVEGCALGIDVGSTSTDLVLVSRDGNLLDFQYLRTAGDPEGAVRRGLNALQERFGSISFAAVGVTGSGRERIGRGIGADAIRDEITAQAKAAAHWVPDADTVFEIGGQDSKYISLCRGQVSDFQMNKICAAGTGSFVEEQASHMGISLKQFGILALQAQAPAELGERCTVFIESAIRSAQAQGVGQADIAAGLCRSIVRNYLHKVVGSKTVGKHIVLQGGVAYNPGIVAAFQEQFAGRLTVSPVFSISGAYGVALLALESVQGSSCFHGFDKPVEETAQRTQDVQENIIFYQKASQLLLQGYDPTPVPGWKTVGIPFALMI